MKRSFNMRPRLFALLAAVSLMLLSTTALSQQPLADYCDESSGECECMENETCTLASIEQIPKAWKPEEIRVMADVETVHNSDTDIFHVSADVSKMPGEGVILIQPGSGSYGSYEEFYAQMSALLGIELSPRYDENGELDFPNLQFSQEGTTVRLVMHSNYGIWAPNNFRTFFWDALTDPQGRIIIDGVTFDLNAGGNSNACEGTAPKAFASGSDSDFSAQQCSSQVTDIVGIPPNVFPEASAQTLYETTSQNYGAQWVCYEGNVQQDTCAIAPGDGFISRRALSQHLADRIRVGQDYFRSYSYEITDLGTPRFSDYSAVESYPNTDGSCATGVGDRGMRQVELKTRDGEYDPSFPSCQF